MKRPQGVVLVYHAIGSCPRDQDPHNLYVSKESFAEQMRYLSRHARVVRLDALLRGDISSGPRAIAITFDDAYRNVLTNAAPVLDRHGFSATVFVPTAFIGRRNDWIEPTTCDVDIMTESELMDVREAGVELESHGHGHIDFSTAGDEEAASDLERSIERLTAIRGSRPVFFAYPFGRVGEHSPTLMERAGFKAAFTIDQLHRGTFAHERVQVTPIDGPRLFAIKVSGRYLKLRRSPLVSAAYSLVKPAVRRLRSTR